MLTIHSDQESERAETEKMETTMFSFLEYKFIKEESKTVDKN